MNNPFDDLSTRTTTTTKTKPNPFGDIAPVAQRRLGGRSPDPKDSLREAFGVMGYAMDRPITRGELAKIQETAIELHKKRMDQYESSLKPANVWNTDPDTVRARVSALEQNAASGATRAGAYATGVQNTGQHYQNMDRLGGDRIVMQDRYNTGRLRIGEDREERQYQRDVDTQDYRNRLLAHNIETDREGNRLYGEKNDAYNRKIAADAKEVEDRRKADARELERKVANDNAARRVADENARVKAMQDVRQSARYKAAGDQWFGGRQAQASMEADESDYFYAKANNPYFQDVNALPDEYLTTMADPASGMDPHEQRLAQLILRKRGVK